MIKKMIVGQLAKIIKAAVRVDMPGDLKGLIGVIADRHGVNSKCHKLMKTNRDIKSRVFLIGCFSHTLDHSGGGTL